MGTTDVFAEDVAAQSVWRLVGEADRFCLVVKWNQAGHRPEDLLLRDRHAIVDIGKDGRNDEIAAGKRTGERGQLQTAADESSSFLRSALDVASHLREVGLADHGPDDSALVEGVADADAPRTLGKTLNELRVDGSLHQYSRAGRAALAVDREHHEKRGIQSPRQIRVIEHDEGTLAAELHRELL